MVRTAFVALARIGNMSNGTMYPATKMSLPLRGGVGEIFKSGE